MTQDFTKSSNTRKEIIANLARNDFFSSFTSEEISLLLYCSVKADYEKGEIIFSEGEIGRYFYAIISGEVLIRREKSGNVLATLKTGEVFGEMAVLDNNPRSASSVANSRVELYAFDGQRLLNDFPHLSVKLLLYLARELSKRLREADLLLDRF